MNFYPYNSPIILTDDIFESYVGDSLFGLTTKNQRVASYLLSEMTVSRNLETFLQITTVTGSYSFSSKLVLENTYVHRVHQTTFLDFEENRFYVVAGTGNSEVALYDQERGLIDISRMYSVCNCGASLPPYKVEVVYTCGLYSGITYQPDILMALCTYAEVFANEIVGYGNESSGDIGVQSFKSQEYAENRVKLLNTDFGSSPKAMLANRMLSSYKRLRYVGM